MRITFAGAAGTVTGSCFFVETKGVKFLVDCGMFQGLPELEARNAEPFPFDPAEVDWLILTHGHLDHLGLVPRLVREGFQGKGICTVPTRDIAQVMLMDAARIQEEEEDGALYTVEDALEALDRLLSVWSMVRGWNSGKGWRFDFTMLATSWARLLWKSRRRGKP
jgi:Cft2 family RNA processing exonuclease